MCGWAKGVKIDSVAASRLPHPSAALQGCSFVAVCLAATAAARLIRAAATGSAGHPGALVALPSSCVLPVPGDGSCVEDDLSR